MSLLFLSIGILALLFFVASALAYLTDPGRIDQEEREDIEREISWER